MTMSVKHADLKFTAPTIGPKVYIAKGPSGWPETFKRDVLDRELVKFLNPSKVGDLVEHFIAVRDNDEKKEPTEWHTVMGFLGRILGVAVETIPHTVGIAFWGQIVIATTTHGLN